MSTSFARSIVKIPREVFVKRFSYNRKYRFFLFAVLGLFVGHSALAATTYTIITGTNGPWSTTANWSSGTAASGAGNVATVGTGIGLSGSLGLNLNETLGQLTNTGTTNFTITATGGTFTFDNTGGTPDIFGNGNAAISTSGAGSFTVNPNIIFQNTSLDIGSTGAGAITLGTSAVSTISASTGGLGLNFYANSTGNITVNSSIGSSGSSITISNLGTGTNTTTITNTIGADVTTVTENSAGSTLNLSAASNNFANLQILSGTVTSTSSSPTSFGLGTITLGGTAGSNATLYTQHSNTFANNIATTSTAGAGTLTILASAGNPSYSGSITLNGSNTLTFLNNSANDVITLGGVVSGTGNLIFDAGVGSNARSILVSGTVNNVGTITNSGLGTGTTAITALIGSNVTAITESSTASPLAISGSFTVNSVTTTLTNSDVSGTAGILYVSGPIAGTGALALDNNSAINGGIAISGSVSNTGTMTNAGTGAGTTLISGTIGGATSVTQNSTTSALVLSSATNTYSGATNVTAGTLQLNSTNLKNTSGVTVGANGILNALGTVTTAGTLTSSGTITLSSTSVNTLNIGGGISLTNSAVNLWLAGSGTAGSGTVDEILVTGAATITGTNTINLAVIGGQTLSTGTYTLIQASGGLAVGGSGFVINKPTGSGFDTFTLTSSTATQEILTISVPANPGTAYWTGLASTTGTDSNNNWGYGANLSTVKSNWSTTANGLSDPLQVPGASTNVIFTASNAVPSSGNTLTTQLDTNYSINSLTFNVPAVLSSGSTISSVVVNANGYALTTGSGGLALASTSNAGATISGSGSVIVNGNQNWVNNNNSQSLVVSTGITALSGSTVLTLNGTGTGGVILSGTIGNGTATSLGIVINQAGTTTLSGVSTYTGATTVSSGTLSLTGTLGSGGGSAISNGATFNESSTGVIAGASSVTNTAGTTTLNGVNTYTGATMVSGGTLSLSGTIGSGGGSAVSNGATFNESSTGVIAGTSSVTNTAGTTTLNGVNTYTGSTTISSGTLTVGGAGQLKSGAYAGNIADQGTIVYGSSVNQTLSGTISGNGSLTESGGSILILSGSNTFTGGVNLSAGTLRLSNATALGGTASTLTISAGTTLDSGVANLVIANNNAQVWNGSFSFAGTDGLNLGTGVVTLGAPVTVTVSNNPLTVGGVISGSFGLTKAGGNTLAFTSAGNNYTGGTTISAGILSVTAAGDLSTGAVTLTGGSLLVGGTGTALGTVSNAINLISSGTISTGATGNTATFNGSLADTSSAATTTLTLSGTGTGNFSSVISNGPGATALTESGTGGTWILTSASPFSGATTISSGTLQLNNSLALQNSVVTISSSNGLTFNSGLGSATMQGLSGASNEVLQDITGTAVTLKIGSWFHTTTNAYTGILSSSGGVTAFGFNVQTFNQANTYTGATTLNNGSELEAVGASTTATTPFGTSAINLNGGELLLAPATGTAAANWTGASSITSGTALSYGSGSVLGLTKKDTSSSVTFTVGGGGTAALARVGNGTLIIQTGHTGDLGSGTNGENLIINGVAPAVTNGMVNASIVGLGTTVSNAGDFLTYVSGTGFEVASYTTGTGAIANNTFSGGTAIVSSTAAATFSGTNSVYALNVSNVTDTIAANSTLNVGDNTVGHQAGIILNAPNYGATAAIGAGNSSSSILNFGADEGIIYGFGANSGNANVNVLVTGSGGVTISGINQAVTLTNANNAFTGGLTVNAGAILFYNSSAGSTQFINGAFGDANNVVTLNGGELGTQGILGIGRTIVLGNQGGTLATGGKDSDYANYAAQITGTGQLFLGAASLGPWGSTSGASNMVALSGNNTNSGGDYLLGNSVIIVSNGSNLGASTNPIIFDGGILEVSGTALQNFGTHPVTFGGSESTGFDIQSAANTFTVSQAISGLSSPFYMLGSGTLALTGADNWTGSTVLLGGVLKIDEGSGGSLNAGSTAIGPLTFAGGTLQITGSSGATTNQNFGNVTFYSLGTVAYTTQWSAEYSGGKLVADNNGGNLTVNLGALTGMGAAAASGANYLGTSFNITAQNSGTGGSSTITTTTVPDNTTGLGGGPGIYGGRMVYTDTNGNANWATGTQIGASGTYTISGYNNYTNYGFADDGNNGIGSSITDNSMISGSYAAGGGNTTINTLKITTSGTGQSFGLGANNLTLAGGGLLFTGSNNYSITGTGTITSGLLSGSNTIQVMANGGTELVTGIPLSDLVVQQYGTGALTIGATIASTSSGTMASLTKAGPGTLVLTAANTYTGYTTINGGTLSISSDANIGGENGIVTGITATTGTNTFTYAGTLPAGFGIGSAVLGQIVTNINTTTDTITLGGNVSTAVTSGTVGWATDENLALNGGTLQVTGNVTFTQTSTSSGVTGGAQTMSRYILIGPDGAGFDVTNGSTLNMSASTIVTGGNNTYGNTVFPTSVTIDSSDNSNGVVTLPSATSMQGLWNLNGGILRLTGNQSLGVYNGGEVNTLAFGASVSGSANETGHLQLNGNSAVVAGLSSALSSAVIENGNGSNTNVLFGVVTGGNSTYSGYLMNKAPLGTNVLGTGTGSLGFLMAGGGTLSLTGTGSTYTGQTEFDGGILNVASLSNGGLTGLTITTGSGSSSGTLSATTGLVNGTTYTVASNNVSGGTTFTYGGSASITLSSAAVGSGSATAATIGVASSLGISSNAAANWKFGGGTLQYTGSTSQSTDHLFTLGDNGNVVSGTNVDVGGNNGTIDASGAGSSSTLNFTNTGTIAFGNTGVHNLTLTGTNVGLNAFAPVIGDSTYNGNVFSTSLTKSGVGTWVLTGNNTYTGTTSINGGKLVINGNNTVATGSVLVNGGATLSGTGSIGGAVTLAGGTTLSTQGTINLQDGSIGTLTLNNGLTIGSGGNSSNLLFDLGGGGVNDVLNITAGSINTSGTGVISVDDIASSLANGNYTLITGTNGLGTANFVLSGTTIVVSGTTYTLSLANSTSTQEILTVSSGSSAPTPTVAYWQGALSGTWATVTSGSTNFVTSASGTANTGVIPGAATNVLFTANSGTNLNTVLGQDFTINSLEFTGSSSTAATSPVTIGGTNTLTIIAGGTNGNTPGNGITVDAGSAAHTISSNVALGSSQTWTVNGSPLTVSGTVAGAFGLTKSGSGTLILSASDSYTGPTAVNSGILQVDGSLSGSSAVTVNAATLQGIGTVSGSVALTGSSTLASSGTLTLAQGFSVSGSSNTLSNGTVSGNATQAAGSQFAVNGTLNGTDNLLSGASLSGNGSVGATTLNGNNTLSSAGTLTVASLGVNGTGNQISSGTVNATGGTTLANNSGLAVNGTLGGSVTTGSGSVLSGTGTLTGALTVSAGARTYPGSGTSAAVLTTDLTYSSGAVAEFGVFSGTTPHGGGAGAGTAYDQIVVTGSSSPQLQIGAGTASAQISSGTLGSAASGVTLTLGMTGAVFSDLKAGASGSYQGVGSNNTLNNYFVFSLGSGTLDGRFQTLELDITGAGAGTYTGTIQYGGTGYGRFGSSPGVTNTLGDVVVDGQEFALSYTGNYLTNSTIGGNDIVLTAIPEPSTWGMILSGFGMLIGIRKLRKRRS